MDAVGAAVVLDVARLALGRRVRLGRRPSSLELVEDRGLRNAYHPDQHAQSAAVGHADLDGPGAGPSHQLDDLVEHRNQDVEALDGEAFLAQVGSLEEALEGLHGRQATEELRLLGCGEVDRYARRSRSSSAARSAPRGC